MSLQTIQIISLIFKIAVPVLTLIILLGIDWKKRAEALEKSASVRIEGTLKRTNSRYFSYERIDSFLRAKGMYYMFGENGLNPATFLIVKFAFAVLAGIVGNSLLGLWLAFPLAFVAFYAIDWLIDISNESDNDAMLMDIKKVYDALSIQTKGSVYISYALLECYMVVENKRLKTELRKMSNYILATNDISTAVKNFNQHFENQHIDALCMTLLQAQENGKSVNLLDDLSSQIAHMQEALNVREQARLERKTQRYEIMIFIGIIAISIYALAINLIETLTTF